MAYFALLLVPRLSLHTLGWQPEGNRAYVCQSDDHYVALRVVARGELELCLLGFPSWQRPRHPPALEGLESSRFGRGNARFPFGLESILSPSDIGLGSRRLGFLPGRFLDRRL